MPAQSGSASDDTSLIATADLPEADATVTRIELEANGTARWSISVRTRLTNESDVEDYRAFQEQFRADRETYRDRFEQRMTGVVSGAADATGRNMTASAFRAETSIQELPRRWGVVTYSVTWTNFATVADDAVVVGDVFEGGLYLGDGDYLEVVPPAEYEPTETSPPPTETEGRTVVWTGPEEFADQQPTVRFEPAESDATAADETTASSGSFSPPLVGVASIAALALVLGGIAVAVVSDRKPVARIRARLSGAFSSASGPADSADGEATGAATGVADDGASSADGADSASPPDPELLTDEDRVRRLLERNGGRIRQAEIADELEWSASKTSRVVSAMADEGTVEKLRIGRENVIDLLEDSE
ncbi:putative membrane protein [Halopiger aswanensis]|uniref:Putative membrane protein n=1 Tax=Halopiger aswanensis TaxID=148449 RepID=A0A3R7HXZ6_9EURY|nr:putative membrane protein [Halopiger aswanensis]